MYTVTTSAGLIAMLSTSEQTLTALAGHLREHLNQRPIGWTITSPWGLVHEGRLNLNGATDRAAAVIAGHITMVADNLDYETSQQHP